MIPLQANALQRTLPPEVQGAPTTRLLLRAFAVVKVKQLQKEVIHLVAQEIMEKIMDQLLILIPERQKVIQLLIIQTKL